MTSYAEQFTGTPLIAGEVFGVRAWNVDSLGRIVSPSYPHVWTPGENAAECKKDDSPKPRSGSYWTVGGYTLSMPVYPSSSFLSTVYGYTANDDGDAREFARQAWPDAELFDCEHDTARDYYRFTLEYPKDRSGKKPKRPRRETFTVSGETLRRRLADVAEQPTPEPEPEPVHDFAECTCGFYAYLNGTNDYADNNVIGVVQGYGETFLGTRGFRTSKARIVAAYASTHADVERVRPLPVSRERMAELYPDVAWFSDYAAMVAEFPPSDPEPTPTTDPEFWTRSA